MQDEKFLEVVGNHFNVGEHADCVELETWTREGVNMIHVLLRDSDNSLYEQFEEIVENFDVDEEVITHYQGDSSYRSAFTLRRSLEDFEDYEKWLKEVLEEIK